MSANDFVVYHNPRINSRFEYPISWTYTESEINPRIVFKSSDTKATFEIMHYQYEFGTSLEDPSKYASEALQGYRSANQFQLIDSGPLSIRATV